MSVAVRAARTMPTRQLPAGLLPLHAMAMPAVYVCIDVFVCNCASRRQCFHRTGDVAVDAVARSASDPIVVPHPSCPTRPCRSANVPAEGHGPLDRGHRMRHGRMRQQRSDEGGCGGALISPVNQKRSIARFSCQSRPEERFGYQLIRHNGACFSADHAQRRVPNSPKRRHSSR